MKLTDLVDAMDKIAPTRYAESWDNVGLLVGDPQQSITRAMLTIDYTPEVAAEVVEQKCDVVIAYHPPIFEALKRLVVGSTGGSMYEAIRRGIAIYSPHTALDVADGGTNELLADVLELRDRVPLKLAQPKVTQCKLVTFVPADRADQVSRALFDAGAGRIGQYSSCSFQTRGTGTFFGEEGTNPAVGQTGKLERVEEIRLETVVPLTNVEPVIRALRQSHPYEEPAFDLNQLAAPPEAIGLGRVGKLPGDVTGEMLINRIKRELEIDHVLVAGDASRLVRKAAVCAGACGSLLDDALAQDVDLYLTGEMRHHDALKAAARGMTVVCTLHSNSERASLKRLAQRLSDQLKPMQFLLSRQDRDPFAVM